MKIEPRTFRKKPVEIEAVRFTGWDYGTDIAIWCGGNHIVTSDLSEWIEIPTLEGIMSASVGDWIIKGVKGEFYPVKPDVFEITYEEVEHLTQEQFEREGDTQG